MREALQHGRGRRSACAVPRPRLLGLFAWPPRSSCRASTSARCTERRPAMSMTALSQPTYSDASLTRTTACTLHALASSLRTAYAGRACICPHRCCWPSSRVFTCPTAPHPPSVSSPSYARGIASSLSSQSSIMADGVIAGKVGNQTCASTEQGMPKHLNTSQAPPCL